MSKICKNLFRISDITSVFIFAFTSIAAVLSMFFPHGMLIMSRIVEDLSLGDWGYLYITVFIGLNYLTFKHKALALIGHVILILILAVLGSGFSFFYMVLFLIYLLPYLCVFREANYLAP